MTGRPHLDEVGVVSEGRENSLETDALFESAEATTNREKRLGHAADAKALD